MPSVFGTIEATAKHPTASVAGKEAPRGSLACAAKKLVASLAGVESAKGTTTNTLKKVSASFTGREYPRGTVTCSVKKLSANLGGLEFPRGSISATLKKKTFSALGAEIINAGKGSGNYGWVSTAPIGLSSFASSSGNYGWVSSAPAGVRLPMAIGYGWYGWHYSPAIIVHPVMPVSTSGYYDRCRFIIEDTHGNILARDVMVLEPKIIRQLSGPCQITCKVHYREPSIQLETGDGPIQLKPWGHWLHVEKEMFDGTRAIIASGIIKPSEIDPESGIMSIEAEGFSAYPNGLPWLVNWNPIAVDPFEIFENIWNHIQSFQYGNLGVTVYPTSSGTQMLPGFSFDAEKFVQDFFAIFIRESDRIDCGDYLNQLARDIPIDYWERSSWNGDYSAINKSIELAYPHGGVNQNGLTFRINENVMSSKQKGEVELNWVSDITIKGWFPQKEYSEQFANADPDRYRRVIDERDAHIDSNERAKAWAHRLLTRRQIPFYYESINIDPYHPNAPFGTWDVGDTIRVQGYMPWHGNIDQEHRIIGWGWDLNKNVMELKLMAEGAFNYDPIEYIP